MNMFSIFDMFMFKYPFIMLILTLINFIRVWKNSIKIKFMDLTYKELFKMFSNLKMNKWNKNLIQFFIQIFLMVMLMNLLGLYPYSFSLTSQMSLVLCISSVIWMTLNIWNLFKNFNGFMSHAIPEGTPFPMITFLYLIEMISNFIRPLTLTLRLMGNMVAGHIFLILIFMMVSNISNAFSILYLLYMMLEFIVSILQAYIICTLMIMYYSEI